MKKLLLLAWLASIASPFFAQQIPLRETAPLPSGLMHFGSAQLPDGDVLVFGGGIPAATTAVWRYDWQTETWSQEPALAFAVAQTASATLSDGSILAVGGTADFSSKVQKSQLYSPATGQWTASTGDFSFFNPIYAHHSVLTLPGDHVLLTTTNGNFSIYDPVAKTWSNQAAPAPLDAGGSTMVWLDGQQEVLFTSAGGQIFQPGTPPTGGNLFYLAPPQPLFTTGVVKLADGQVLTMNLELNFNNTVTRFDPVSRTATAVTNVPFNSGVDTRSAIRLPDGRVLTFGTGDFTQPTNTKVIQVYDPAANTWETGAYTVFGPLRAPQMHLLPDSTVLAISTLPENITGSMKNRCWILGDNMTSVEEIASNQIRLVPNPASNWLEVKGLSGEMVYLSLFRSDGKLAAHWENVTGRVDLSDKYFTPGLYFFKVGKHGADAWKSGKIFLK